MISTLSKEQFQSFYSDIHRLWISLPPSLECTEKELVSTLVSVSILQTCSKFNETLLNIHGGKKIYSLIKDSVDVLVSSFTKEFSSSDLAWLFLFSIQETDGLNTTIKKFEDKIIQHLSAKLLSVQQTFTLRCSFISPTLIEFANRNEVTLLLDSISYDYLNILFDKGDRFMRQLDLILIPSFHLWTPAEWKSNTNKIIDKSGITIASINDCDIAPEACSSFICYYGNHMIFDLGEDSDNTVISDLADGWASEVPSDCMFTRNIPHIRECFSGGCLEPVECGGCTPGKEYRFLKTTDFHPEAFADNQVDTSYNNMTAANEGDMLLGRPAIIVDLDNLTMYIHTSRFSLGIPKDICERSIIVAPKYVDSMFCKSALEKTAQDLYKIFSKREYGFEHFTGIITRKFWALKAHTEQYDMDDPISDIACYVCKEDKKEEFVKLMEVLSKIQLEPYAGLDRDCSDIRYRIQEEYSIIPKNNDEDYPDLLKLWSQFWTLSSEKLQKGSENYNKRKHKLPPSIVVKERALRGEWPMDINPIEDLCPFISKGKQDELVTLMRDIQRVYKGQAKTMPKDRVRIMKAVDKHFGIICDKDRTPAGKAFMDDNDWEYYHIHIWMALWGRNKEDDPSTKAAGKELDYKYLIERISNGEWIR